MIGDILVKLGKGEQLTIEEQQRIRLWGNQVDNNNAYIAGIQNGIGNISADSIYGRSFFVGKEQFSGLAGRFINDGFILPIDTVSTVTLEFTIYNDGYSYNGSAVTIPTSGFYNITMDAVFGSSATPGIRRITDSNDYMYIIATAAANEQITLTGSTDVQLTTGQTVYMKAYQNSEPDLSITRASMTIRKIR